MSHGAAGGWGDEFVRAYDVLEQLSALILAHQGDGTMSAAMVTTENPTQTLELGGYALHVALRHDRKSPQAATNGYVLAIADAANRFVIAGQDVEIVFTSNGTPEVVELGKVEEGVFKNEQWLPGRRLNGDEIMLDYALSKLAAKNQTGTGLRFGGDGPSIQRVNVFRRH